MKEVVSFTSLVNRRSQAVMEKIGMSNTGDNFMHPDIEHGHCLSEHVLYKIEKQDWQKALLQAHQDCELGVETNG